jgi:hypothetical protein
MMRSARLWREVAQPYLPRLVARYTQVTAKCCYLRSAANFGGNEAGFVGTRRHPKPALVTARASRSSGVSPVPTRLHS